MTTAKVARNALWLIVLLAALTATTFKLARRDLTITRAAMEMPPPKWYEPTDLLPQLSGILRYVGNYAVEDATPQWGAESRPSVALASILQINMGSEPGKLIPTKHKLWDLLNEIYISGVETAPTEIYRSFGKSIFMSEPIQQVGLCEYIDRRVMPGLAEYLTRGDYGGARRLVSDMMAWIGSFNPSPRLATNNPKLQGYINFFLRLDALLNDPITLYSRPTEAQRIVAYVAKGETPASDTVKFLQDKGGELATWGQYFAGQTEMRKRNFSAARIEFEAVVDKTKNPRLKDIANLGRARSLFWGAKSGTLERASALAMLADLRQLVRPSFHADLAYYEKELRSSP